MKTVLCKISIFLLMIALLLPMLLACGSEPDEEVLATARSLLTQSAEVNALCFAEGILPTTHEAAFSSGGYTEADTETMGKYGVTCVADIRAKISAVYSVAAAEQAERILFSPVQSEGAYASYRRYYDTVTEDGRALLMVKREYTPLARGTVSYDNVRLKENARSRAVILVDITVTDGERTRTLTDESFSLRREESGWRLDTLTYASVD